MALIKLTYAGVADFMASTPTKQRKILTEYKYPDEDEPRAKVLYYREARDLISAYHNGKKENVWLEEQAIRLSEMAALEPKKSARRTRLENNSRTLLDYSRNYKSTSCDILPQFSHKLEIEGVLISVFPELHIIERKKEKLVKLDFGKKPHDDHYNKVSCQILYLAALSSGLELPSNAMAVRHIATKTDFKKARAAARVENDIEATCGNISAIWGAL